MRKRIVRTQIRLADTSTGTRQISTTQRLARARSRKLFSLLVGRSCMISSARSLLSLRWETNPPSPQHVWSPSTSLKRNTFMQIGVHGRSALAHGVNDSGSAFVKLTKLRKVL